MATLLRTLDTSLVPANDRNSKGLAVEPIHDPSGRPLPPSRHTVNAMTMHISLVGRRNLSAEVYRQVRDAIINGMLRPGDRLPASRELARTLSVSRMTVTDAYDRLTAEGFLLARVGDGTFVSEPAVRSGGDAPLVRRTGCSVHAVSGSPFRYRWHSPIPPRSISGPEFPRRPCFHTDRASA